MSQQINLYNPLLLKQKTILSALNLVIVMGIVLMLIGSGFGFIQYRLQLENKEAERSTAQLATLKEKIGSLGNAVAARVKNAALEKQFSALEVEIQRRQGIATILKDSNFGNTEGYSSYLTAFARQIPVGVWLTGFTLAGAGSDINLQGRTIEAEMLPVYVTQLKREVIMQGKTFSALQMQRPQIPIASATASAPVIAGVSADPKKTSQDAPYLEFELHSSGMKEKITAAGAKAQ